MALRHCGFLLCLAAFSAQAAVVQVSSPGLLNGTTSTIDFESSFSDGPSVTINGVTFSSPSDVTNADFCAYADCGTSSGSSGLANLNLFGGSANDITIDFSTPVTSAGLYFGNDDSCCSSGFDAYLDLYYNNVFISALTMTANMNDFADQFIGFNSDSPIDRMILRYGASSEVDLYRYIDDVTFSTDAVTNTPEPSSAILLGTGIAGIYLARRRRS